MKKYLSLSKYLLLLLICLSHSRADGQFNNRINIEQGSLDQAGAIREFDGGYICNIRSTNGNDYSHSIGYITFSKTGEVLNKKLYPLGALNKRVYNGLDLATINKIDFFDLRVLHTADTAENITETPLLIKFNTQADTLWTRLLTLPNHEQLSTSTIGVLSDSTVLCVMIDNSNPNVPSPVLFKVSPEGDVLKTNKVYTQFFELIQKQITHPNGNTYLVGFGNSNFGANVNVYSLYVMCIDADLTVKWTKHYATDIREVGQPCVTSFGNIMIPGAQEKLKFGTDRHTQKLLFTIDEDGNLISQNNYGETGKFSAFMAVHELSNGDYIVIERSSEFNSGYSFSLSKFNFYGSPIWSHKYGFEGQLDFTWMSDMQPTSDGGFVMAGYGFGLDQDVWVTKVDSNGIGDFPFETLVYDNRDTRIKEMKVNSQQYAIVNNTNSKSLMINWEQNALAPDRVEIINANGQCIVSEKLGDSQERQCELAIPNLQGLHLIILHNNKRVLTQEKILCIP